MHTEAERQLQASCRDDGDDDGPDLSRSAYLAENRDGSIWAIFGDEEGQGPGGSGGRALAWAQGLRTALMGVDWWVCPGLRTLSHMPRDMNHEQLGMSNES